MRFAIHTPPKSIGILALFAEVPGNWSVTKHQATKISDEGRSIIMLEESFVANPTLDSSNLSFNDIPRVAQEAQTAFSNEYIVFGKFKKLSRGQGISNLRFGAPKNVYRKLQARRLTNDLQKMEVNFDRVLDGMFSSTNETEKVALIRALQSFTAELSGSVNADALQHALLEKSL